MARFSLQIIGVVVGALVLNSCAVMSASSIVNVISVSDFLVRGTGDFDKANPGELKSIVLFTDKNSSKNKKFCEAFVKLAPLSVAKASGIKAQFAPVYWLLKNEVSDRTDCNQLLKSYDYQVANLYLQRYGQSLSKGPVLVAVDKDGNFAFIDVAKANGRDIKKVVFDWGNMMQKNGMQNVTVTSPTFLQNLAGLLCNTTTQMVALHTPAAGADPTKPQTFGFDATTGKWNKPSVYQVGAILLGGTITNLACAVGNLVA